MKTLLSTTTGNTYNNFKGQVPAYSYYHYTNDSTSEKRRQILKVMGLLPKGSKCIEKLAERFIELL